MTNAQIFRTREGGKIDREEKIYFIFNGKKYYGYKGDTLASALLANGIHLIGTDVPQKVSLVSENCWSSSCSALNSPELFQSFNFISFQDICTTLNATVMCPDCDQCGFWKLGAACSMVEFRSNS